MVEVVYLIEKGRIASDWFDRIFEALQQRLNGLTDVPFDLQMADVFRLSPASLVPDMPDRMIAATASVLGVPLVTKDAQLQSLQLTTIW